MSLYDDLQIVSKEILKDFKQGIINLVQVRTSGNSSPDAPELEEVLISLDATAKGVSFEYIDNTFITVSDTEVTSAVVDGVEPSANDFIEIDGTRYKILRFLPLPKAGIACVWKFIVRKGG